MIVVEGRGLHAGQPARVTIRPIGGDRVTTVNGAPLDAWSAERAERSTQIAIAGPPRRTLRTVEHLFAALAAMGAHRGIAVDIDGPEPPIVDGGAAVWMDALAALGVSASAPRFAITREEEIRVATSVYRFTPGAETRVSVAIELGDRRLAGDASWSGDAREFRDRIAPARTFCFAHEVADLASRGLGTHVPPESVVVLGESILSAGAPFAPDEPARHKLLDLVGDLFLYGGPPRGHVHAYRPGHFATHEAMRIARDRGVTLVLV